MPGDIHARNVCLKSLLVVNRNLTIFTAGRGLDPETFQHRQIGVGTDQHKNYIVRQDVALSFLVLEDHGILRDLDQLPEKEELEAMIFQFLLKRLLYPILDTALFRIRVLPIAAKDRQRRVGSLLRKKQGGLAGRVASADNQRTFLHPRIRLAKMIVYLRQIFTGNVQLSRIVHSAHREQDVRGLISSLVGYYLEQRPEFIPHSAFRVPHFFYGLLRLNIELVI